MKLKSHSVGVLSSSLRGGKRPLAVAMSSVLAAASVAAIAAAGPTSPITPVATGLNNPRGLTFGPEGNLYVAEAGLGQGDGHGGSALGIGFTGAITEIQRLNSRKISQRQLVTGLASVGTPGHPAGIEVVGPDGLSYNSRQGLFVIKTGNIIINPAAGADRIFAELRDWHRLGPLAFQFAQGKAALETVQRDEIYALCVF